MDPAKNHQSMPLGCFIPRHLVIPCQGWRLNFLTSGPQGGHRGRGSPRGVGHLGRGGSCGYTGTHDMGPHLNKGGVWPPGKLKNTLGCYSPTSLGHTAILNHGGHWEYNTPQIGSLTPGPPGKFGVLQNGSYLCAVPWGPLETPGSIPIQYSIKFWMNIGPRVPQSPWGTPPRLEIYN